jgi:hypothetical protein
MREDIYAARTWDARQLIAASIERLAAIKNFEDAPEIMAATTHKEPEMSILFEREALAGIVDRLVTAVSKKRGEVVVELQAKVDELTAKATELEAANTALLAEVEAFKASNPARDDAEDSINADTGEKNPVN